MLTVLTRSTVVRTSVALALLAMPFVIMSLTDNLGSRRGLWASFIGVLLGVFVERPFRPYNVTSKRWVGRRQWVEVALVVGLGMGLLLNFADSLGRGMPFFIVIETIWIPLYRTAMFAAGLTLLRRVVWEREKSARSRSREKGDEMMNVPITPALPKPAGLPERGHEQP